MQLILMLYVIHFTFQVINLIPSEFMQLAIVLTYVDNSKVMIKIY